MSIKIVARHSKKVLAISEGRTDPGAQLIQWDWLNTGEQMFDIIPVDQTWSRFQCVKSGLTLCVNQGQRENGANIIQYGWQNGDEQQFRLDQVINLGTNEIFYRIINKNSGKVMGVSQTSMDNGATVIQWDWNSGEDQQFQFPSTAT
jgi:endoglucanase